MNERVAWIISDQASHLGVQNDEEDAVPDHRGFCHLMGYEGSQGGDVIRQSWPTLSQYLTSDQT